jgi:FtsP/CotA-like multicopper oxidase with cupredoxin domain
VVTVPPKIDEKGPDGNVVKSTPGEVVIRTQFKDFPGWFVFHCHILNHEDDGMMQSIQVLKPGDTPTPPPHDETSKSGH